MCNERFEEKFVIILVAIHDIHNLHSDVVYIAARNKVS